MLIRFSTITGTIVFPGNLYSEDPKITFFSTTLDLDSNRLVVTAGFANATYVFERHGQDWVYQCWRAAFLVLLVVALNGP